jgi:hypothetical protein
MTDTDWIDELSDPPGIRTLMPDGSEEFRCPLVKCAWVHREPPPRQWGPIKAPPPLTAEDISNLISEALAARHAQVEQVLAKHLASHPPAEWVAELMEARRGRTDLFLVRSTLSTINMVLRGEGIPRGVIDRVMRCLLYGHQDGPDAMVNLSARDTP